MNAGITSHDDIAQNRSAKEVTTMSTPIEITIGDEHATVDGKEIQPVAGKSIHETAIHVVARQHAQPNNAAVTVLARDPSGDMLLSVHPDGTTSDMRPAAQAAAKPAPRAKGKPRAAVVALPSVIHHAPQSTPNQDQEQDQNQDQDDSTAALDAVPLTRAAARESRSFLVEHEDVFPAPTGWRGLLNQLGFKQEPTEGEKRTRIQNRAVSQLWPGTRSIAIANGKGGAGKTPTAVLLSAIYARQGGAGVLAWDCNNTRGTLGWRTEQGPHDATVLDLLPHATDLLSPAARSADLAAFIHHQTGDRFDVLRSNPLLLSTEQKLTPDQLDEVHTVAAKYYRMIIMDSGNDEGDALWLRMIDHTDQLVVPTSTRTDHAEAARLLLDALHSRDEHSAHLADNAVVIVSQAEREEKAATDIAAAFAGMVAEVVTIPYDPAMRHQWLRYEALNTTTQAAYLTAAAAVAKQL